MQKLRDSVFAACVMGSMMLLFALTEPCTIHPKAVITFAEDNGFHDVRPTGYAFFHCSSEEEFTGAFLAKTQSNVEISGAICCDGYIFQDCRLDF